MTAPAAVDEILLVDDQREVQTYVTRMLDRHGYRVTSASDGQRALTELAAAPDRFRLVLLDLDLGATVEDGLHVLQRMRASHPELPVIILTGKGTMDTAIRAMKLGAADVLAKDLYIEETLTSSVEKVRELVRIVRENQRLRRERRSLDYYRDQARRRYQLVGQSPALQACLEQLARIASVPRPVLILGERGVGKELVAATLHYQSLRAEGPFVTVNCAAFSGDLLESEIFGHEKGAFTTAVEQRPGRFEQADRGTLFLDEIGNMGLPFQEKILRVLEYQRFERVGGREPIEVDVRVVAATNADLPELIRAGRFRADLYDRLTFATVEVPPLRERLEDLPELVAHFTGQLLHEVGHLEHREWAPETLAALARYAWPGNVRELKHTVEQLVVSAPGPVILPEHLPARLREGTVEGTGFHERVASYERRLLLEALGATAWNQAAAARRLGLSYDQFRHFYRKFSLADEREGR